MKEIEQAPPFCHCKCGCDYRVLSGGRSEKEGACFQCRHAMHPGKRQRGEA
jgi:hypothetical protein